MNYSMWMKRSMYLLVLVSMLLIGGCDEDFEAPPEVTITDDFVDLRPRQSVIKDQGNRTTCIVFAGLAAVEAAYIRQGFGELELSPEFINFTRKAFYLHPLWDEMLERGPNGVETQLGSAGGGGGVGVISNLNKGFKVPLTDVMPYHDSDNYYRDAYPAVRSIIDKIVNDEPRIQREYSTFNLDSTILNNSILRHDKFYSVGNYRNIENPRDPAQFESALRRGYEVVWDFAGANPGDPGGRNNRGVWQRCDACGTIPHSMLIVGYDKRSSNSDDHYFIVKNSWGPDNRAEGSQGFTYISYDYVRSYGAGANYVTLVNPPQAWPELAFIGRWKLNFDGHRGELDIYHLP
ncbi:MAG: C1 family peptidase, partial [Cyclobacteriaceae bacterium]